MIELVLSNSAKYFKLRGEVLKKVKKEACQLQYKVYYNLLTKATDSRNNPILAGTGVPGDVVDKFVPNYPKQLVTQFALGASKTIDKIAEDAIELILPRDLENIAKQRTAIKAKANGMEF
jgi:hypothetical protein